MTSVYLAPVPRSTVAAQRDDGPLAAAMGRLVLGQIPPLPPVIAAAFVTGALLLLGVTGADDFSVFAPAVVLLLAGAGSSHPHDGRLDWLVPPVLRLTEYGFVASLGFGRSGPPVLIALLIGAIAFHHYDLVHRLRQRVYPPSWLAAAGLGWDGRMLLIAFGGLLDLVPFVFAVLAVYLWGLFGWESLTAWLAAPGSGNAAADADVQE